MVETIGELHRKTKELETKGLLKRIFGKLVRRQEEVLGMKHFGIPELVVTMEMHGKSCYENGKILLQYWDEEYLHHELGHFYLDELHSSLSLGPEKNERKEITEWWEARDRMIDEGVAEYFRRKMTGGQDDFNDSEYPERVEDLLKNLPDLLIKFYYSGGYHLVKPILDRFGVEEGCRYLLLNPPREEELTRLPEYRRKVLNEPPV